LTKSRKLIKKRWTERELLASLPSLEVARLQ